MKKISIVPVNRISSSCRIANLNDKIPYDSSHKFEETIESRIEEYKEYKTLTNMNLENSHLPKISCMFQSMQGWVNVCRCPNKSAILKKGFIMVAKVHSVCQSLFTRVLLLPWISYFITSAPSNAGSAHCLEMGCSSKCTQKLQIHIDESVSRVTKKCAQGEGSVITIFEKHIIMIGKGLNFDLNKTNFVINCFFWLIQHNLFNL